MMQNMIQDFIVLWVVIDPIGSVPVFISHTTRLTPKQKKQTALKAAITAFFILLFFLSLGQIILDAMEIPLESFQIAGGLVLLYFAFTMIFGESKPESEMSLLDKKVDVAIFPLAVPSLASPGAMMAVVLLTDNYTFSLTEQLQTVGIMMVVIAIAWLLLRGAGKIQQWIGDSGAAIISRVMGLILASVALNSILEGIKIYFKI
ncbi:MAG: MarC family protein [Bacteroidales bacterium]|jgi:multiple antibiotic resistance protein